MASKSVELAIRMSVDASNVASEFDQAGDAALRMADDVDRASTQADTSARRLDGVAESADGMASSSSQAAGGIGDLAGALAATGLVSEGTAAAMETGAMAIMGVTGAADLLNLATKSTIISTTRQRIATIASTVATNAQTVAQKALNIAMRANPIGLIITAVIALVALFVVLYRRSETFRAIVGVLKDKVSDAFGAMLRPIQWVIDKVKNVIDWISDAIQKTKNALGLGKEYGSTMGRILGNVMDDLSSIGDQIRDNYDAQNQGGGASGGGVGNPRLGFGLNERSTGQTVIDARVDVHVDASSLYDETALTRVLEDLLRRQRVRLGELVPGAKVVTS
jgi:hypothetical protein